MRRVIPLLFSALFLSAGLAEAQTSAQPKLEVGAQLTQWYLPVSPNGSVHYQPGVGAFSSYDFSRYIGFDAALNFMGSPVESTSFVGGSVVQGQLGIRAGVRKGRVGLYGKVRPGFVRFSDVILSVTPPPEIRWTFGALTKPSLDLGGIVTVNITRRFAVRYELGDTMVFYGERNPWVGAPPGPSYISHNFQWATGFAIRF
jgi:hypothetical protein